jgi:hypothetical protein
MPVRTDIAIRAERIIVFMIVLLDSLWFTLPRVLGLAVQHMAHFAEANRCCHAPVTNSDHARLKKAALAASIAGVTVAQFALAAGTTTRTITRLEVNGPVHVRTQAPRTHLHLDRATYIERVRNPALSASPEKGRPRPQTLTSSVSAVVGRSYPWRPRGSRGGRGRGDEGARRNVSDKDGAGALGPGPGAATRGSTRWAS